MLKTLQLTLLVLSILLINGQNAFAYDETKVKTGNVEVLSVETLFENQSDVKEDAELDDILHSTAFHTALFSHLVISHFNYTSTKTPTFFAHFIRAPPVNS